MEEVAIYEGVKKFSTKTRVTDFPKGYCTVGAFKWYDK